MHDLEIGQVLWLRIRFNNSGSIAVSNHPCLIIDIDYDLNTVEIAHMDSLEGKEHQATSKKNKVVYATDPTETVIYKDSYAQLNNTIKIENHKALKYYRETEDKLSPEKLAEVIQAYRTYHQENQIDENRQVYIDEDELEYINRQQSFL
jgi:hypothetical protein